MPVPLTTPISPGTTVQNVSVGSSVPDIFGFSSVYMLIQAPNKPAATPVKTPLLVSSTDGALVTCGLLSVPVRQMLDSYFVNSNTNIFLVIVPATTPQTFTTVTVADWVTCINDSLTNERDTPGYIIAPEFFWLCTDRTQRMTFINAVDALIAGGLFDGVFLADCARPQFIDPATAMFNSTLALVGQPVTTLTDYIAERTAVGEKANTSLVGNFARYQATGRYVPASVLVSAIGMRRFGIEGWNKPPAGVGYPALGFDAVYTNFKNSEFATLASMNINCFKFSYRAGVFMNGARMCSSLVLFRWTNAAQINAVLRHSLRYAFEKLIFDIIDGAGLYQINTRQAAESILYRLYTSGCFYGARPQDAYMVRCDNSNNPPADLAAGLVRIDILVALVPTLERLAIGIVRTNLGEVQVTYQQLTSNQNSWSGLLSGI